MSIMEQMSQGDVKKHLSETVDRLEREHGHVVITWHGRPAAVVLRVDGLESKYEALSTCPHSVSQ